jgi:tRNA pseudouridine55 synthase
MTVHGILNLRKPPGKTSMDVSRLVKRLTGERKVGHGGTLDPMASGVLPILLGQATHMMDYLIEGTKGYEAQVLLGVETDTLDATGKVTRQADASGITRAKVEAALQGFRGAIRQVPPMYSALKRGGERLYEMARAGVEVPREPREVEVFHLQLLAWEPPTFTLMVECGRGVYIRSLARDLGEALGCGAHLTALVRHRTGPFTLEDAVAPEELTGGSWQGLVYSPDFVVSQLRAAVVGRPAEGFLRHGRQVALGRRGELLALHGEMCRVYSLDGRFLALVRFDRPTGLWQPIRVFVLPDGPKERPLGDEGLFQDPHPPAPPLPSEGRGGAGLALAPYPRGREPAG